MLENGTFHIYGGENCGNTNETISGLSEGPISENIGATFGGGVYTGSDADIENNGFKISNNSSLVGEGICNNGSNAVAESSAVIANNNATAGGDDIAQYGNSLKLAPVKEMNERLTTDNSNELITV